jgi:hypothetical protein
MSQTRPIDASANARVTPPLDPRSEHGREVADRLEGTLAELLLAVRAREHMAQSEGGVRSDLPAA